MDLLQFARTASSGRPEIAQTWSGRGGGGPNPETISEIKNKSVKGSTKISWRNQSDFPKRFLAHRKEEYSHGTQPTQKQEEKLLKCLKTFAKPQISLMHTYVLHHVPHLIQKVSVDIIYNRNRVPTLSSRRHAWCDFDLICDLNPNCDLSSAHSIWIYDADPWDETSDSSMSNLLRFTNLGHT